MVANLKNQLINLRNPVKIVVLVALLCLLVQQFSKHAINFSNMASRLKLSLNHYLIWIVIIGLVIFNYTIESLKWKILSRSLQKKTFSQAFQDISLGLLLGLVSPLMLGDFWGRSLSFEGVNKLKSYAINLFNSVTQTYTAILFGFLALFSWQFILIDKFPPQLYILSIALLFSSVLGLFFIVKLKSIKNRYLNNILNTYLKIDNSIRFKVLLYSIVRTVIYNLHFLFVLRAFDCQLNILVILIGTNLILLIKTVGGGLNIFGDLAIRQLVGISFFSLFSLNSEIIILATLSIWTINIFIPALFGAFFLIQYKSQ